MKRMLSLEDIRNQPRTIKIDDPYYIKKYMGRRIVEEYSAIFVQYSWNNPNYDKATFHTVFGALMKFVRFYFGANFEDVRFHTHIFAPTSTGKSRAFAATFDFAEALGLKVASVNKLTSASLIGTIDREHDDKIIYGKIMEQSGNDIVGIEEASVLYNKNKSEHEEDILKILQSSMNPYRSTHNRLTKALAVGEISGYSPCSYLFATYPPATISDIITETGFLQRLFILYRQYNDIIRRKNEEILINSLGNTYSVQDLKPYHTPIINKLKAIERFYKNYAKVDSKGFKYYPIDFTPTAKKLLKLVSKQLEYKYSYSYGSIREQLANFRTRFMINIIKLAVHHALLRLSPKVDREDIAYAQQIAVPEFETLMFFIESSLERNEMDRRDAKVYKVIYSVYSDYINTKFKEFKTLIERHKLNDHSDIATAISKFKSMLSDDDILLLDYWVPKTTLIERVCQRLGITKSTAENYLNKFTLDLMNITKKSDVELMLKRNPQARFIASNTGGVRTYIRAVHGLAKLPQLMILPELNNKSPLPNEIPAKYQIKVNIPKDIGIEDIIPDMTDTSSNAGKQEEVEPSSIIEIFDELAGLSTEPSNGKEDTIANDIKAIYNAEEDESL